MDFQSVLRAKVGAALIAGLALTGSAGCEMVGNLVEPEAVASASLDLQSEATFCVDEVNRLRAAGGAAPLANSGRIATFSTEAAQVDGEAHEAHRHFYATRGGDGVSRAQNEIPWWKPARYGSVRAIVREGLAMMYAEGPGHGHYDTMMGNFSEMGCGIAIINGEVTVSQDFR
jgi:hypothetical protein